jgi:hypothetical protein
MARPERNSVDYFPFYCDEGQKMFYIEKKYGNDGFSTFIKILRELAKKEFHYLNLNEKSSKMFLAAKCNVSEETLVSIINDLCELGKFDKDLWSVNIIWCQDFIDSIQDAYGKRNNKCITFDGLRTLLTSLGVKLPSKLSLKVADKPQSIVEYSIEEQTILSFDQFWILYDKKEGRKDCERKYEKISEVNRKKIFETLPLYVQSTPDKKFRKNPETYLNGEHWNDEIKVLNNQPTKPLTQVPVAKGIENMASHEAKILKSLEKFKNGNDF